MKNILYLILISVVIFMYMLATQDRITEIAIFKHDGEKIVDQFNTFVNPERKIPVFIFHDFSNKWNEWLLQEGVEDIGLPPAVAHYLRQQDEAFGPVENKHLTWIGQLVKEQRQDLLLSREQLMEIRRHLKQAVRVTLEKRGIEDKEAFGELWAEALAPLRRPRAHRAKAHD